MSQDVVHVVDDEPDMRSALVRLFRSAGMEATTYSNALDFLDRYRPGSGGCVVLDLMMPGLNGRELQATLNERDIRVPVLFLTGAGDINVAVEAMRAGAADFIEKPFENEMLVQRVRRALHLGSRAREEQRARSDIRNAMATLTPREHEIMDLVVAGEHSKDIAQTLSLSVRTVEVHRAHIMEKMQAKSLADLVRMVLSVRD